MDKSQEYRPIDMLPTYKKLVEVLVNLQFKDYFEIKKLWNEYQARFIKNKSSKWADPSDESELR